MSFQKSVNLFLAKYLPGDFVSTNPRQLAVGSVVNTEAGSTYAYLSPVGGVTVGTFVSFDPASGNVSQNPSTYSKIGFIPRTWLAVITDYLGESSYVIPQGLPLNIVVKGADMASQVWPANVGANAEVWAENLTGMPTTGQTSVTGSISGTTLTVTAVAAGALVVNGALAGAAAGTVILSQVSGTPGGVGTYAVNISQTVASGTLTQPATDTGWKTHGSAVAGDLTIISA